jgi:uncharacterized membrane-anchored protein
MAKLPTIAAAFWVMKICATTLGETGGDLMSMTLNVGYGASSAILISIFALVLACQLLAKTHQPFLYWSVILATSTAGTTMSDYMDRTLGIGYAAGSAILFTILVAILLGWRLWQKSIDVQNIASTPVEAVYWTAILFSNTLGTALGDFLADDSGLGFSGSATLIGSLLALVLIAHFFSALSKVLLFWVAFVLTRPFGAAFGDVLTKPVDHGGLNLGTYGASAVLFAILVTVILLTRERSTPETVLS